MSQPKHMAEPGKVSTVQKAQQARKNLGLIFETAMIKRIDQADIDADLKRRSHAVYKDASCSVDLSQEASDAVPCEESEIDGQGASIEQIGRSAALMSVLVIVSRITGFFRTWGQVYAMGVTVAASCYTVANNLPNQLYELVMGGMLVTAFLPVYLSVKRNKGRQGANEYTSNLLSIVFLLMGAVCLLGLVFASQVVWSQSFSANKEFDHNLAVYFFRFFAIEIVLYSLSTIVSGVLNAERDYLMSSAAPIFNNVVVTSSFFLYGWLVGHNQELALLILALGNPLGVLIQVVVQLPSLRRHGIRLTFKVNLKDPALKETLSIGVPSVVVTIVSFITVSVQTSCALSVSVAGSSIAYYTRLWYTLPYSILAIPITTAMFTELSERMSHNDMKGYVRGVVLGTSQISFFLMPCALLLVVFAHPLIVILAAGKLSEADVALTVSYLQALALSLPFFGICTYLQKVCSSLRKMGVYAVANVIAGIIQVIFCFVLTPVFGLTMVALSSLFYFVAVDIVTFIALKASLPELRIAPLLTSGVRTMLFSCGGSAVALGLLWILRLLLGAEGISVSRAFLYAALAGLPALCAVFAMALFFKAEEADPIRAIVARVTGR